MKGRKRTFKEKLIDAIFVILTIVMFLIGWGVCAWMTWIDIAWKLSFID